MTPSPSPRALRRLAAVGRPAARCSPYLRACPCRSVVGGARPGGRLGSGRRRIAWPRTRGIVRPDPGGAVVDRCG